MDKTASKGRKDFDRRSQERRTNPHPFNSLEWEAMMREKFVLWPKFDRRASGDGSFQDRRLQDRRNQAKQRLNQLSHQQETMGGDSSSSPLTDEEVQYIFEVFNEN
jgi:hypothetical protein